VCKSFFIVTGMSTIPETIVAHHCGIKVNHRLFTCAELVLAERHFFQDTVSRDSYLRFLQLFTATFWSSNTALATSISAVTVVKIFFINNIVDLPV
jgi:hypothetical protein